MNYQDYYIPVNFTDAGKLAGMFPIRNTIEALLLALPAALAADCSSISSHKSCSSFN